jgi:GLPGLI family protein
MSRQFKLTLLFALLSLSTTAQQNQGKVVYDLNIRLQFSFDGKSTGLEQLLPASRTVKYELLFGNNQSIWKQQSEPQENLPDAGNEGNVIKLVVAGGDDILYCNLENQEKTEKRMLYDKAFLIEDTITKLKWKLTGETKTILNYVCVKAETTRIRKDYISTMEGGTLGKKEVDDTTKILAWFTSAIPVSAGPSEFQGQLPGLILELDMNNGELLYKAVSFDEKADISAIKAPTGKKKYTQKEFLKEKEKLMDDLNNRGGNKRVFRM